LGSEPVKRPACRRTAGDQRLWRVATRYDKLTLNFLSAVVLLAVIIAFWI
jgi:hypothetical protein